ncbi:MAG: class I SAM-dependent methyltransferase [Candidatus Methylomirabilaceae bacterium]
MSSGIRATGTGRVALRLLPMLPEGRIIGVDPAAAMLQRARGKLLEPSRYRLVGGTAEGLPIHSGAADVVLITFTLHHIANALAGLLEAYRALKEGGRLVILDPVAAEPDDALDQELHRAVEVAMRPSQGAQFKFLTTSEVCAVIEQAGFAEVSATEIALTFAGEELEGVPSGPDWHEAFEALADTPRLRERFQARYLRFEGEPPRATGKVFFAAVGGTRRAVGSG